MTVCNGQGSYGTHCCYMAGKVCQFLIVEGTVPRCSLYDQWGALAENPEWSDAPIGRWFADTYPGFDCGDWPQNIPQVMAAAPTAGPFYTCCWGRGNHGDVG